MSERISSIPKYSAVLCAFVVLIHDSIPAYFEYGDNCIDNGIHFFLTEIVPHITSIAVPSFFILSGFLFYKSFSFSKLSIMAKYKSRFYSLIIPYLCWNTIGLLIEMFTRIPVFAAMGKYMSNPFTCENVLSGVFLHKYTLLWFVFALIVYSYLCPFIFTLIRSYLVGIMVIITIGLFVIINIIDIKLPNGSYFESSSFFYYLIGAFIGCHHKDFYYFNCPLYMSLLAGVLMMFVICIEVALSINSSITICFNVIKSFLFWFFFSGFVNNIQNRKWFYETFFIYVFFHIISRGIGGVLRLIVDKLKWDFIGLEFMLYLITFVLTLYISIYVATLWKKVNLKSFIILTGNRV